MAVYRPRYLAYLLRVWQTDGGDETEWRASLQRPGEEVRCGFASLEELFAFLRSQTRANDDSMDKSTAADGPLDQGL